MTDRAFASDSAATRAAAIRLLEALSAEHDALIGNKVEAIESAVRAKQALIAEIGALPTPAQGGDPELEGLLEKCRHQNDINGAIVAARLHLTELTLAVLRGEPQPGLYGPRGGSAGQGVGRSIARA